MRRHYSNGEELPSTRRYSLSRPRSRTQTQSFQFRHSFTCGSLFPSAFTSSLQARVAKATITTRGNQSVMCSYLTCMHCFFMIRASFLYPFRLDLSLHVSSITASLGSKDTAFLELALVTANVSDCHELFQISSVSDQLGSRL